MRTLSQRKLQRPAERKLVSEHVVERIRGMIADRELLPGQRLPAEREFAKSLGVSRPSLREALSALSDGGLVNIRQGSGATVSQLDSRGLLSPLEFFLRMDSSQLLSLFEARLLIEPAITALAADRLSPEQLRQLADCLERSAQSLQRPSTFLQVDVEFHQVIVRSCGNPFLERVAESLSVLGKSSRAITVTLPGLCKQSHADHIRIFKSLANHDCKVAEQAMRTHLRNVQGAYLRQAKRARPMKKSPGRLADASVG